MRVMSLRPRVTFARRTVEVCLASAVEAAAAASVADVGALCDARRHRLGPVVEQGQSAKKLGREGYSSQRRNRLALAAYDSDLRDGSCLAGVPRGDGAACSVRVISWHPLWPSREDFLFPPFPRPPFPAGPLRRALTRPLESRPTARRWESPPLLMPPPEPPPPPERLRDHCYRCLSHLPDRSRLGPSALRSRLSERRGR